MDMLKYNLIVYKSKKNWDLWFVDYLRQKKKKKKQINGIHLTICIFCLFNSTIRYNNQKKNKLNKKKRNSTMKVKWILRIKLSIYRDALKNETKRGWIDFKETKVISSKMKI